MSDAYLWTYGDGITSTVSTITHTHVYTTAGVYTVSLTAFNPYGRNTYTKTAYIRIYSLPVAGFSASPIVGVVPLEVTFSNTSQDVTDCLWNFGDGATSTVVTPTHIYTAAGVYTVSLQVSNLAGSDWFTRTSYIMIHPPSHILYLPIVYRAITE
jgi:PKD repeat protein